MKHWSRYPTKDLDGSVLITASDENARIARVYADVSAEEFEKRVQLVLAAPELFEAAELALDELDPEGKAAQALARAISMATAVRVPRAR